MAEEWIATWDSLDEPQRTSILAKLQAAAKARQLEDRDQFASSYGPDPVVEIRDVTRDGEVIVVYMFHWWESCGSQSGSDWNYHRARSGTAVFRGDELVTNDIVAQLDDYIHEYSEKDYSVEDALAAVRTVIDESL